MHSRNSSYLAEGLRNHRNRRRIHSTVDYVHVDHRRLGPTKRYGNTISSPCRSAVQKYLTLFALKTLQEFFDVIDNRKSFLTWTTEIPIHISACQRTSIVANDHAVWIEHRNDFEHHSSAQFLGKEASQRSDHWLDVGGALLPLSYRRR